MNKPFFIGMLVGLLPLAGATAQVRVNDPGRVVERNVEYRTNSKIDQGINKGLDKVEEGIMGIFKKKNKPATKTNQTDNSDTGNNGNTNNTSARAGSSGNASASTGSGNGGNDSKAPATLKSYGKFDFVPGEKVMAAEDFMQDAIGDFPDKWNSRLTLPC